MTTRDWRYTLAATAVSLLAVPFILAIVLPFII